MFAASFESTFNTFVKLRFDKIYDAIITTPVNAGDVIAGEYLWAGTRAALYGTGFLAMLIALGTAFGEAFITSWGALFSPPMLLVIGIILSVLVTWFTSLLTQIDLFAYRFPAPMPTLLI